MDSFYVLRFGSKIINMMCKIPAIMKFLSSQEIDLRFSN